MKLNEKYADRRDEFVILAFHDDRVQDFAELDAKLESIIATTWKGKSLPFPILLDSTGKTLETYGIRAFPTTILIDPQGRIVDKGNEGMLEEALNRAR